MGMIKTAILRKKDNSRHFHPQICLKIQITSQTSFEHLRSKAKKKLNISAGDLK
jgi:hypothetical protein